MLFLVTNNAFTGNVANNGGSHSNNNYPVVTKGSISFTSSTLGANVYLDNNLMRTINNNNVRNLVPIKISNVNVGRHTIKITKTNYLEYNNTNVDVIAGQTTNLGLINLALLPKQVTTNHIPTVILCTDSDGDNTRQKGYITLTYSDGTRRVIYDSCRFDRSYDPNIVTEYVCNSTMVQKFVELMIDCTTQYGIGSSCYSNNHEELGYCSIPNINPNNSTTS